MLGGRRFAHRLFVFHNNSRWPGLLKLAQKVNVEKVGVIVGFTDSESHVIHDSMTHFY